MTARPDNEILIFPVGSLNFRLELAKRVKLDHPGPTVKVIRRHAEEIGPLPEGIRAEAWKPWKGLLSFRGKSGIVPFCQYAWFSSFSKVLILAYLSGVSPIRIYRDDGSRVEEEAFWFFAKEVKSLLLSGISYLLLRGARVLLPLLTSLWEGKKQAEREDRIWFIIPVYPDLSHHFIFQQVLALSRLVPCDTIAVFKGDSRYRANYMASLDQQMKYFPEAKRICLSVLKNFCLLALRYPRKLLNVCLELEQAAREEGQDLWSLRAFLWPFNPLYGLALYGISRGHIPKAIHTYGLTFPTNYGLFFSMLFDIPHTATYFIDVPEGIPFRFFKLKEKKLEKVIVHTEHCIQELEQLTGIPPGKMSLIPFGTLSEEAAEIKETVRPSELLAVGRLIPKKGFDIFIEACKRLRSRGKPLRCLIVGSGPELPQLISAVRDAHLEEWVHFLGDKCYDDYLALLLPHRILVQPSVIAKDGDHDGVPAVILEAMARGLVVIGTSVGGIPEVIEDGRNGFLVLPNDPEALATCIERVISTPAQLDRVAEEARSTILHHYDVHKLAARMARECRFI
jgi:glycosyltransferase involved in cell wall biosynthesis